MQVSQPIHELLMKPLLILQRTNLSVILTYGFASMFIEAKQQNLQ
jgi:hypothetical protein